MRDGIAGSLRNQAQECLRLSRSTTDPKVHRELLTAAAWLHEKAARLEGESARRQNPTDSRD